MFYTEKETKDLLEKIDGAESWDAFDVEFADLLNQYKVDWKTVDEESGREVINSDVDPDILFERLIEAYNNTVTYEERYF